MKPVKLLMIISACMAFSCEKGDVVNPEPEPEIPTENTLQTNKTSVTLRYLERDTIIVAGVEAQQVKWSVAEGGDFVTLKNNGVVIGRRKGNATILAQYQDKSAAIEVAVTSEEYIPVEKLIWEINGALVESTNDKTLWASVGSVKKYSPTAYPELDFAETTPSIPVGDTIYIKLLGYQPANASCPIVDSIGIYRHWYKVAESAAIKGDISSLMDEYILEPTNYLMGLGYGSVVYYMNPFPPDLTTTAFDIEQLSIAYRSETSEYNYHNANKFLNFYVKWPSMSIESRDSVNYMGGKYPAILLKSGESKSVNEEVLVKPFVPKGLENTYRFIYEPNSFANLRNNKKLHFSPDGLLTLDSNFSFNDIETLINNDDNFLFPAHFGNASSLDELRELDTLCIGNISVELLPLDGGNYKEVRDKYGETFAFYMNNGRGSIMAFWVKND